MPRKDFTVSVTYLLRPFDPELPKDVHIPGLWHDVAEIVQHLTEGTPVYCDTCGEHVVPLNGVPGALGYGYGCPDLRDLVAAKLPGGLQQLAERWIANAAAA